MLYESNIQFGTRLESSGCLYPAKTNTNNFHINREFSDPRLDEQRDFGARFRALAVVRCQKKYQQSIQNGFLHRI